MKKNMNILVTGASSGIGRAVSNSLASRNHHVIAVARTQHLLESLRQDNLGRLHIIPSDISTISGCDEVVDYVRSLPSLDGIVHAAGSGVEPMRYQELNVQKILEDMNIHVMTPITINQRLRKNLTDGRVLYIDSDSADSPRNGWAGYSIVKAAAQMAARSAADEMDKFKVIRVFPGGVRTPLVDVVLNSKQQSPVVDMFNELNTTGRLSEPQLIGEFIANILTSASDTQLDEREYWRFDNSKDQIFSTTVKSGN